jgi:hypothetical protein
MPNFDAHDAVKRGNKGGERIEEIKNEKSTPKEII